MSHSEMNLPADDEAARRDELDRLRDSEREMLRGYSAALDEIYRLRQLCAYEAAAQEATLAYATFPKSRRATAEASVQRLREAARGGSALVLAPLSHLSLRHAMRQSGAKELLTQGSWEESLPRRSGS